jgi:hypothetical protein
LKDSIFEAFTVILYILRGTAVSRARTVLKY